MRFCRLIPLVCIFASPVIADEVDPGPAEQTDFSALRQELGWSDDFSRKCESGRPLGDMVKLMNEGEWAAAAELALPWLDACPIDIRVHYYRAISLSELGQEDEATPHLEWTRGLMDSIFASGDGKTPQTAFVVVSIAEEYDVLSLLGLKRETQSLVGGGEALLDQFEVTDEDGETHWIYFNPAAHFARLARMFPDAE